MTVIYPFFGVWQKVYIRVNWCPSLLFGAYLCFLLWLLKQVNINPMIIQFMKNMATGWIGYDFVFCIATTSWYLIIWCCFEFTQTVNQFISTQQLQFPCHFPYCAVSDCALVLFSAFDVRSYSGLTTPARALSCQYHTRPVQLASW